MNKILVLTGLLRIFTGSPLQPIATICKPISCTWNRTSFLCMIGISCKRLKFSYWPHSLTFFRRHHKNLPEISQSDDANVEGINFGSAEGYNSNFLVHLLIFCQPPVH